MKNFKSSLTQILLIFGVTCLGLLFPGQKVWAQG